MRKFSFLIFCVTIMSSSLYASGGFGGFYISYITFDMDALNTKLAEYDYPGFDKGIIGLGGGGFAIIDNLLIGGEGFGGNITAESATHKLTCSCSGGFFDIGYGIPLFNRIQFFGIIGIGGSGATIQFYPQNADVAFDSLLVNPARESAISYSTFSLNLSTGIQIFNLGSNFVHGLIRGGYILNVTGPDWKLRGGNELFGGPDIGQGFPYIGVSLLFGGREEEYD